MTSSIVSVIVSAIVGFSPASLNDAFPIPGTSATNLGSIAGSYHLVLAKGKKLGHYKRRNSLERDSITEEPTADGGTTEEPTADDGNSTDTTATDDTSTDATVTDGTLVTPIFSNTGTQCSSKNYYDPADFDRVLPAPPRPRRPECRTSSRITFGSIARARSTALEPTASR